MIQLGWRITWHRLGYGLPLCDEVWPGGPKVMQDECTVLSGSSELLEVNVRGQETVGRKAAMCSGAE